MLRHSVGIHETTVQRVARKERVRMPRKRTPKPVDPPVEVTKVHPGIWKQAMKLAKGDAKRIQVVSKSRVVVLP